MRFLLDENISQTVSRGLRDSGYGVLHVLDTRYCARPDEDIIKFARRERRVIVTHDKDFGNLLRFPAHSHAGVILIRLRNQSPHNTLKYLLGFLRQDRKVSRKLVVIREGGYTIVGDGK